MALAKSSLKSDLEAIYSKYATLRQTPEIAVEKAEAIYKYVKSGTPMTIITSFPGSVSGAMTGGPVKGIAIGGFDKPAPGMGLPAAKSILKSTFISIWTHGNAVKTIPQVAQEEADAIDAYYSQAIIMTKDESSGPLPCPPVAGPAAGAMKGKGGVISDSPGSGFDSAKPTLISEFIRIWNQIDKEYTVESFATQMSEAIHNFCIEAKIDTDGSIVAPAAVDPVTTNGAYFPGVGMASGKAT